MRRILCAVIAGGTLWACGPAGRASERDPASVSTDAGSTTPSATSNSAALTKPIALIADTQFHESRGVASRYFSLAGDEFVDVTIRPGQVVIGAADILQHALERAKQFPLVIHAGDAMDLSCETEWSLFTNVFTTSMKQAPGPKSWLFAPGNHDGYLTGNIYPPEKNAPYVQEYWANMCNAGRHYKKNGQDRRFTMMPKERLVAAYMEKLGVQAGLNGTWEGCTPEKDMCWSARSSKEEPWMSYVVQLVKMPMAREDSTPIFAVLLDSSDYDERPFSLKLLAGETGSLSARQLRSAVDLTRNLPTGARYFLVTHHPAKDWKFLFWSAEQKAAWSSLLNDPRSLHFLVSAHTHDGFLQEHREPVGSFTELNTGSLADDPIYIRSLAFERDPAGNIGFTSDSIPLLGADAGCKDIQLPTPKKGYEYGTDTQTRKGDRATKFGDLVRVSAAIDYAQRFEKAKHAELRPQLLAYADVVDISMPAETVIEYDWTTLKTGVATATLTGRDEVSKELRKYANCDTGKGRCSYQAKGELLRVLEEYYWTRSGVPDEVKLRAHKVRLCLALDAAVDGVPKSSRPAMDAIKKTVFGGTWKKVLQRPTPPSTNVLTQ